MAFVLDDMLNDLFRAFFKIISEKHDKIHKYLGKHPKINEHVVHELWLYVNQQLKIVPVNALLRQAANMKMDAKVLENLKKYLEHHSIHSVDKSHYVRVQWNFMCTSDEATLFVNGRLVLRSPTLLHAN